jgi:hypothetical protein
VQNTACLTARYDTASTTQRAAQRATQRAAQHTTAPHKTQRVRYKKHLIASGLFWCEGDCLLCDCYQSLGVLLVFSAVDCLEM